jgi:hypothetical protein
MRAILVRTSVAIAVVGVALDGGSYGLVERHTVGVLVWWTLFFALAVGLLPRRRVDATVLLPTGCLVALAGLSLASATWGPSVHAALLDFDLILLYVGVLLLFALGTTKRDATLAADGLALGVCFVAVIALASRLAGSAHGDEIATHLPNAANRLAFPLGYWNGLGVLVAIGVPLCLRIAVSGTSVATRAAAIAAFPTIGATLVLTSSRTAVAVAALGSVVFVALSGRLWPSLCATSAAIAASGLGALVVLTRSEVVEGPFGGVAWTPSVLLTAVCLSSGLGYWVALRMTRDLRSHGNVATRSLLVAGGAAVALAVGSLDLEARISRFAEPPRIDRAQTSIQEHLVAGTGSGRWQFWSSAVDEFAAHPVTGGGAGSFEPWWLERGTLALPVRSAHSLYLETLAELGFVGLALVAVGLLSLVATAARSGGTDAAAVSAALIVFALAAGVDWVWDLPAVGLVAGATGGLAIAHRGSSVRPPERLTAWRPLAAALCLLVTCAQALPLLSQLELEQSQSSVRAGKLGAALENARAARDLQPWATVPLVQVALVHELAGRLDAAQVSIDRALELNAADWRIWLVDSRLQTKRGAVWAARRSLCRAAELNPRSPLFSAASGLDAVRCGRSRELR